MANKITSVVLIATGGLLALGYVALTLPASSDEPSNPAIQAVADLRTVTGFSIGGEKDGCTFDEDRGGLVMDGLTVKSKQTGSLELTFYVQRDSLDDILQGYVTTVFAFDEDTRSHTIDLVIPVTRADYEAGYDECYFSTGDS